MARSKTRGGNIPVPQNAYEAESAIRSIGEAQRLKLRLETQMNDRIAAIKAKYEEQAAPLTALVAEKTEGLRIYCEANREALTDGGKTKTVQFGAGKVSWRSAPPKVSVRGVETVIEKLKDLGLFRFIRTKDEIDKEAMRKEPDVAGKIAGVTVGSEGEDFAVEPFNVAIEGEAA